MADMHLVNIEENAVYMGEDSYPLTLPRGRRTGRNTCKYCGTETLHWSKKAGEWRLSDTKGKIHYCDDYKNRNKLKVKTNAE